MTDDEADDLDETAPETTNVRGRSIDKASPEFFRNVLDEYVEADRLRSGVARIYVDDGGERRFVIGEAVSELSDATYVRDELAELIDAIDASRELFPEPLELEVPVGDEERVVKEVTDEGTVTVLFQPDGLVTLLETVYSSLDEPTDGDS